MKKWKHKTINLSVGKLNIALRKSFELGRKEGRECLDHAMRNAMDTENGTCHPYRRGKNRCKRCGLKINF